nr:hypothetical protein [Tanacetum cinerariifolium]GEY87355.1 hypothetical protein [Tanacetum cinerariifolium]GEY92290.1 hypothetical protein [Tanacetum cinerariifolium]
MPPTMTTQRVGRLASALQGRGMGGRAGSGGGRTRGRFGNQGDGRIDGQDGQVGGQGSEVNGSVDGVPNFSTIIAQQLQNLLSTIVAQAGDQGRGQGNGRNQNGDILDDHIWGDVRNATKGNDQEYNGKEGTIVYTRWIEKMELVHDMSRCRDSQRVKYYTAGSLLIAGTLTDEAFRNGTLKKNPEKRRNGREPSKDRNGKDDNKRTRTRNAFATTANLVRGGYTDAKPKYTTCSYHHPPETPRHSCFSCNRLGYFAIDCRVVPRNVNPINARNPFARTCYECSSTDHIKSACPRLNQAQILGGTIRTKSWLLMGARVVETKETKLGVGNLCWEQRRLART